MKQNHKDSLNQAPDHSETALLLIDVINPMEFDGSDKLLRQALPMANALAAFKFRAKQAGVPAIYTNDNFGRWRSDFPKLVQYCSDDARPGSPVVRRLLPEPEDYFVLKPKHSAFYQTNLETLLNYLGVKTVIVTGVAGDICVLFTANDAYMRDLNVIVPPDCIASEDPKQTQLVLELMHRVLKAEIQTSTTITLNPNGGGAKSEIEK
jgi:nicotinamidase-related amidase